MKTHKVTGGGGIRLHVEETGKANGQPILFIHGFSQCRLSWNKQIDSDLANDFRLVTMDIRGHGLSDKPRNAYGDSKLWADDINAVLATLGLDRPVLSGWSYGGLVICDYLRFYGEKHIGGINLVGAVSKLGTDAALAVTNPELRALTPGLFSNETGETSRALQAFVRMCVYEEPSPADFYFFLGYNLIVPPYVRQGLFSRSLENDDLLSQIRQPVFITHGEKDAIVLLAAAEQNAAAIRHAQTSFYPKVGHAPFWEDAPRFNRELRAFAQAL